MGEINFSTAKNLLEKSMNSLKSEIEYYEKLLKYTKHSKCRDKHKFNISFLKMVLADIKDDYFYIIQRVEE